MGELGKWETLNSLKDPMLHESQVFFSLKMPLTNYEDRFTNSIQ